MPTEGCNMTPSFTYEDAIEEVQHLGFAPEINRIIVNLVEHHVLKMTEIPTERQSDIVVALTDELASAAHQYRVRDATKLSQALRVRIFYWKGTARMRHGTFGGPDERRLQPTDSQLLFFVLRHIADALENAAEHLPLFSTGSLHHSGAKAPF